MKRSLSNQSLFFKSVAAVLLVGSLGLVGAAVAADKAVEPAQRLPASEKAAAEVRAAIQGRMARHGNTMSTLVKAVVLLDRPTITTLSLRIADEELVARIEGPAAQKARALLPKAFLDEQDQLRDAARELAKAAAERDSDTALADRFATLARTCVSCHSVYLGRRVERK